MPKGFFALGYCHEVDVVGHEAVGPDGQAVAVGVLLEEPQVRFAVAVVFEYVGAAIAPLGHVVRISRNDNARYAAHALIIGQAGGEMEGNS